MIPHNLIKRVELPEGYKILRSYFARTFDYGTIPHRSAKEAEERAQDDKLNSSLELRVVILDPTGTKTDIAVLLWKPQITLTPSEEALAFLEEIKRFAARPDSETRNPSNEFHRTLYPQDAKLLLEAVGLNINEVLPK